MIILIPAYEPDQQLPALIRSIRAREPHVPIVVVDDGSGQQYRDVFVGVRALGGHVISYGRNRGKGFARKTGFGFIAENLPGHDVVCADSDGQHTVVDILRVAEALGQVRAEARSSATMVLGSRSFTGDVPARSRLGNNATKALFALATGERIPDNQTGLRGYPATTRFSASMAERQCATEQRCTASPTARKDNPYVIRVHARCAPQPTQHPRRRRRSAGYPVRRPPFTCRSRRDNRRTSAPVHEVFPVNTKGNLLFGVTIAHQPRCGHRGRAEIGNDLTDTMMKTTPLSRRFGFCG